MFASSADHQWVSEVWKKKKRKILVGSWHLPKEATVMQSLNYLHKLSMLVIRQWEGPRPTGHTDHEAWRGSKEL